MKITSLFLTAILCVPALVSAATTSTAANTTNPVHTQLDQLAKLAQGKRLGILTNGSARDLNGRHDVDYLVAAGGTTITAFFGPEHGFRGDLPDGHKSGDHIDPATSIPVYSLYGKRTAPTDEQLANVDILVFDIPDVGVRFYTYVWTMTHAMESAARNGKTFVVIDRPNPITGTKVEGAVNRKDLGLVGRLGKDAEFGVATRHGLTAGELATLWNSEWMEPKVDLKIIKAPDWKREQWWDETGRPFIAPSPNMRTLDCAIIYPGTCIFEGTNLNEGRGTSAPFEMIGAPFVDGKRWAEELNKLALPGVTFEAIEFTPESRRHAGKKCSGVRVKVTDREALQPVRTGVHMLQTVKRLHPDEVKITDYAGKLMATPDLQDRILTESADSIVESWQEGLEQFKKLRAKHLLY